MKESTRAETERVRHIQDKEAPRYDRQMGFFDRILFAGGRIISNMFSGLISK